jgi:hypothetical protein
VTVWSPKKSQVTIAPAISKISAGMPR